MAYYVKRMMHPFLIASLLCLIAAKGSNIDSGISYQIHSNNDLREFPQNLIKGATRYKFDPHYMSTHPNCPANASCLLLSHDKPSSVSSYNTSDELLDYLGSEDFANLTAQETVTVALCFKAAPEKCVSGSKKFADWLDLVDAFYTAALGTLPDNVEIILDGDAKPVDCLVGKWTPWKSVWIVGDSPPDAFYLNTEEGTYISRPYIYIVLCIFSFRELFQ